MEIWEDVPEEPFSTSFYTIVDGRIKHCIFYNERVAGCPDDAWAYIKDYGRECIKQLKEVGLYFGTKEEAELAVRKLKAWKRLKDKGFKFKDFTRKFDGFKRVDGSVFIVAELDDEGAIGMIDELNICFGGEE